MKSDRVGGDSVADILSGLLRSAGTAGGHVCPQCGATWPDCVKRGLGCSQCYAVFHREIRRVLTGRGSRIRHVGRVPLRLVAHRRFLKDIDDLNGELRAALRREDYEQAAAIRNKLKQLGGT